MLAFLYRGTESDGPNFIVAARKVSDERQDRPPEPGSLLSFFLISGLRLLAVTE